MPPEPLDAAILFTHVGDLVLPAMAALDRGAHKLAVTTHEYPLDAADRALADLEAGRFDGAAVLVP